MRWGRRGLGPRPSCWASPLAGSWRLELPLLLRVEGWELRLLTPPLLRLEVLEPPWSSCHLPLLGSLPISHLCTSPRSSRCRRSQDGWRLGLGVVRDRRRRLLRRPGRKRDSPTPSSRRPSASASAACRRTTSSPTAMAPSGVWDAVTLGIARGTARLAFLPVKRRIAAPARLRAAQGTSLAAARLRALLVDLRAHGQRLSLLWRRPTWWLGWGKLLLMLTVRWQV